MEEDTEFKKLPIEEQCVHKLWKARLNGYDETIKIFRHIDDERSAEWNRFVHLLKKFVVDAHAMAQERGLEATLICVENCAAATKVAADVLSGVVQKCVAAQKTKTRELAVQLALLYVEVERQETVVEELIRGMEHKNPKIVAACTTAVTEALREFGHKVIAVKPLVKQIGRLLSDRDKAVRTEGKAMTVEIYRWIGDALKPQLAALPAVVLSELEAEFGKMGKEKAQPTRFLKSQQAKVAQQQQLPNGDGDGEAGADDADAEADAEEIDPMDLIDPVDILARLPKDFYDKLEEKKWQTRKEALEALDELLKNPKLLPGDYGELCKALKKILAKDSNVMLVAMAGRSLAALARGLAKKFAPYAPVCSAAILEKFKEKKPAVVAALRDAIDSIYPCTSLEAMQEDLFEALANKNPSVKAETAQFLARSFARTQPAVFTKKLLKPLVAALLKTLNESDPAVRDGSAEALGMLQKLLGEKALAAFVVDVDPLKLAKVKECAEKAVVLVRVPVAKKAAPVKAAPPAAKPADTKTAVRPGTSTIKRPASALRKPGTAAAAVKKPPATNGAAASSGPAGVAAKQLPTERELTPEEVVERAAELLPGNCVVELSDANWKTRLAAAETLLTMLAGLDGRPLEHSQVLCKVLCQQKPGLKDNNFQVVKLKLEALQRVCETMGVSVTAADGVVGDVVERLADTKNAQLAGAVLVAMAESLNLQWTVGKVLGAAFEQKSPKVQSEALLWTTRAVQEFGLQVNPKLLIDDLRKGIQSTNATVRQAAFAALGGLHLYTGDSLMMFFDAEKPAIKQQIQSEFDKNSGQKAPPPSRGPAAKASASATNTSDDDPPFEDADDVSPTVNLKDLLPRVDISGQITEAFLAEISDKNWKTRNEGLIKLQGILNESKLIGPNIGDLPHALAQRLVDSNAKIAQTALAICQQLAEVMGAPCRQYVRAFFPGFLNGLGDGKQFIRAASITCMNVWGDQCGYKEFFEAEMIADALRNGSPALRAELWCWLADKMPGQPVRSLAKDELMSCLPHLYTNLCDRSADVRKHANDAVFGFMLHLGYETMLKGLEKVKPSSKKDIQAVLDKTRPNLPVKPLPKGRQQAPLLDDVPRAASASVAKSAGAAGPNKIQKAASGAKINALGGGGAAGASASSAAAATAAGKKNDEEVDMSPMLLANNLKNQRMLDEQKLKVLKWNFTTPREEFIELLRDQMQAANVNKGLLANMFHADFRYHLKAIDMLLDDLPANGKALICNLDLVLKWVSLRFYDTNPSVLLKGLEYLQLVFEMLCENQYDLAEAEGSCFIPHLLIKIGDPKDTVRHGVRQIIRQICLVYPYTKVFAYTMDGLKSKNARQRTECLDELGSLIERYGINVCQPSPAAALKEVARHIGDRDNSVRSAALNCIVQAHFLIGERVQKMIGNLSDKDTSMLEERIKRAMRAKRAEVGPGEETVSPPTAAAAAAARSPPKADRSGEYGDDGADADDADEQRDAEMAAEPATPPQARVEVLAATVTKPKVTTGPFGLDPAVIAEIEKDWVRASDQPKLELPTVDLSFLHSPLKIAEINGVAYPAERLNLLINRSRQQHAGGVDAYGGASALSSGSQLRPVSGMTGGLPNLANELPKQLDAKLVHTIESIGNASHLIARSAISELHDIFDCPEKHAALRDYEDLYIEAICQQFKHLGQQPTSESLNMYQPVLSSIYTFFTAPQLGKNLSVETLKLMMSVLLGLMADNKLTSGGEDGQYTKVLNGVCLRILERSNFSHLNCALIRLLKESCMQGGLPKFTELLMKCIWRNVKVMPEKAHEMEYGRMLHEIHDFMAVLPSVWWAQRPDTPLRTVKTIIHNMVKLKGKEILQYLQGISPQSELHGYLLRVLKNFTRDAKPAAGIAAGGGTDARQPHSVGGSISKETHEEMSAIFKQIATKSAAQSGIAQLYEYKKKHPELDMAPFLHGANPVFLKFIEDGLAEMERNDDGARGVLPPMAADNNSAAAAGASKSFVLGESSQANKDPDYWMDRLKVMMNRDGAAGNENVQHHHHHHHPYHVKANLEHSAASDVTVKHERAPISGNRLELLQHKLSQIRQQKPSA